MGFDLNSPFGEDLTLGPAPDLSVVGQVDVDFEYIQQREEFIQRIIRRLLTNKGEWIPFPQYGGGLRQRVNSVRSQEDLWEIRQIIDTQIRQEPDVAVNPPFTIDMALINDGLVVTIKVYSTSVGLVSFWFKPVEI